LSEQTRSDTQYTDILCDKRNSPREAGSTYDLKLLASDHYSLTEAQRNISCIY